MDPWKTPTISRATGEIGREATAPTATGEDSKTTAAEEGSPPRPADSIAMTLITMIHGGTPIVECRRIGQGEGAVQIGKGGAILRHTGVTPGVQTTKVSTPAAGGKDARSPTSGRRINPPAINLLTSPQGRAKTSE